MPYNPLDVNTVAYCGQIDPSRCRVRTTLRTARLYKHHEHEPTLLILAAYLAEVKPSRQAETLAAFQRLVDWCQYRHAVGSLHAEPASCRGSVEEGGDVSSYIN